MKARHLALPLALMMMVAVLFAVPMASAGSEEPIVYNPALALNEAVGEYGFGGSLNANSGSTTATFSGDFSLVGYSAWSNITAKYPNGTVPMTRVKLGTNLVQFYNSTETGLQAYDYGYARIYKYSSGNISLEMICGQNSQIKTPIVLFTAPTDGIYDITAADFFKTVKAKENGIDTKVTFSVEKFAKGTEAFAPGTGETLSYAEVSANNREVDFPTKTGVELKAGEIIAFRATGESVSGYPYKTRIEVAPIITRVGDITSEDDKEEDDDEDDEEEITPPAIITTPLTYDPRVILNDAAGTYGFDGADFANGATTIANFSGAFSVAGYGDWSAFKTKYPSGTASMTTVKIVDSNPDEVKFFDAQNAYGNGYIRIMKYSSGNRTLEMYCGEKYNVMQPIVIFTAPTDGIYDITAADNCKKVTAKDSGLDKTVVFSIEKYAAGTTVFGPTPGEVLASVTLTSTSREADFPTQEGVRLQAGEIIAFRLDAGAFSGSWSKTRTEVAPIITRRADVIEAPVTNLGAQIRGVGIGENTSALRFGFELPCTGVNFADATHANGNYKRALTADSKVVINGQAYTIVDFGAVLSLNESAELTKEEAAASADGRTIVIPALNLYEVEDDAVTYTAVINNVPVAQAATKIFARSYVTYMDGEEAVTVYGKSIARCLNDCGYDALG